MKKVLCCLVLLFTSLCFAASTKITNKKNEFGGVTKTTYLSPSDAEYEKYTECSSYYDKNNVLIKSTIKFTKKITDEYGYTYQDAFYQNGVIVLFKMYMSKAGQQKYGITEIAEFVDEYENATELWYRNDKMAAKVDINSFTQSYPLFSLSYLEKILKPTKEDLELPGDDIFLTRKYFIGRSFVKLDGNLTDIDNDDKKKIEYYLGFTNSSDMIPLYTKKTKAYSGGKEYVVYIQTKTAPYIKKNQDVFLSYGFLRYNGKFYLLMTEFDEVEYINE